MLNEEDEVAYYPQDSLIKVVKSYSKRVYFDKIISTIVDNNCTIDSYKTTIWSRLIYANDYDEFELENEKIYFQGYGDDDRIDSNGFYSFFWIKCSPDKLKKANYVTFKYFDSITNNITTRKIRLNSFARSYNTIEK